jgi:hypothetical protein
MITVSSTIRFRAGLLTTAANVPQVWKTYRSRFGKRLFLSDVGDTRKWSCVMDHLRCIESFDAHRHRERGRPCARGGVDHNEVDF